jgi:hypothetical protein
MLEYEIQRWKLFRNALSQSQKEDFDKMMDLARIQATAGSAACNPVLFEPFAVSILLGQHEKIMELHERVNVAIANRIGLRVKEQS